MPGPVVPIQPTLELFTNFAKTVLERPLLAHEGILFVVSTEEFPAPNWIDRVKGETEYFRLVLTDSGETQHEVCICHSVPSKEEMVVLRGQEDTDAQAWPVGTKVEHRMTAGTLGTLAALDPIVDVCIFNAQVVRDGRFVTVRCFRFTRALGGFLDIELD